MVAGCAFWMLALLSVLRGAAWVVPRPTSIRCGRQGSRGNRDSLASAWSRTTSTTSNADMLTGDVAEPLPKMNRPTVDDVIRISWGKPAKKKGTGSRGVPHRLNADERTKFDFALTKGFVEIDGSGWRSQRRDSPLSNTFRNYCDAKGWPVIAVHKMKDGIDQVLLDLSPLRDPEQFQQLAEQCPPPDAPPHQLLWGGAEAEAAEPAPDADIEDESVLDRHNLSLAEWRTQAIFRLPMYSVLWTLPRAEAKALAKHLAKHFKTASSAPVAKTKGRGMPKVKHGKSRRHGGYGIG